MSSKYNFNSLLFEDKELNDVEFIILNDTERGGLVDEGSIMAHKLPLSLVSPVFKSRFFGPMSEQVPESDRNAIVSPKMEKVVIKGHSFDGFKMMITFIYTGETEAIMTTTDLFLLFDLLSLSKKYFLAPLSELIMKAIVSSQLSFKDYVMVLTVLRKYSNLNNFEDICAQLKDHFVGIVSRELTNPADIFSLNKNAKEEGLCVELMKMLEDRRKNYCPTCDKPNSICGNGKILDFSKSVRGQRVRALDQLLFQNGYYVANQTLGTLTDIILPQQASTSKPVSRVRRTTNIYSFADPVDTCTGSFAITWDSVNDAKCMYGQFESTSTGNGGTHGPLTLLCVPSKDIIGVCSYG